jgi:hypothetical protein
LRKNKAAKVRQQIAIATAILLLAGIGTSFAADRLDLKRILLDPRSPATSRFVVEGWPSFVFMPGAPWRTGYQRSGSSLSRSVGSSAATVGDIDCADIAGPVFLTGDDPNRLDGDGDGIGCE